VFVPDIADAERMTEVITAHADDLGVAPIAGPCRLLDARIRHSHRPSSPRCQGWATYSVPTDGGPAALLYVRGYPERASAQPWAEVVAAGRAGGAIHLREHDLIVWKFPEDPSLPALRHLVDPTRIVALLPTRRVEALTAPPVTPDELHVDVVRYQPEASATLRCRVARPGQEPVAVYAKAVDADPTGIGHVHERLWDRSAELVDLRIAQPLGSDPTMRVLWTLGVPGPALGGRVEPGAAAAIARTVAALHGSGVSVPHVVHAEECLTEGRKKASKLAAALPRCGPAVAAIAPPASRFGSSGGAPRAVVHGDLHLDQFIDGPDGPVLVDLDSVAAGDAELDLAELVVDVVMRSLPLPAVQAFVLELLEAYARHARPVRPGLLRALADAEFLTRCHRSLRRRAPGWEIELELALAQHAVLAAVLPST
jgi:hypothetical protein